MKRNGFTLIELLVVVAIIGILAAVGVVAYNGYTGAAKVNAVKAMHKNAVKYITHEVKMCDLGEFTRMEGRMSCASPARMIGNIPGATVAYFSNEINVYDNRYNAYVSRGKAISNNINTHVTSDGNIGSIYINSVNPNSISKILISSCNKTPCKDKNNRLENYISVE